MSENVPLLKKTRQVLTKKPLKGETVFEVILLHDVVGAIKKHKTFLNERKKQIKALLEMCHDNKSEREVFQTILDEIYLIEQEFIEWDICEIQEVTPKSFAKIMRGRNRVFVEVKK